MTKNNFSWENASLEKAQSAAIENTTKNLRTAFPAKIVSFNPENQTAVIECVIHNVLSEDESGVPLPPLEDVPVQFPRSSGFDITYPLKPGDEGIAIISDRCIDGWWSTGNSDKPMMIRSHDLSDAMFIPGINSVGKATSNFDTDALAIRSKDGSQYIKLFENGNIEMDGTQLTVKCPAIFEQLVTYQNGISGTAGSNGNNMAGGFNVTGGDITADKISLKYHGHIDSIGGKTSEAQT